MRKVLCEPMRRRVRGGWGCLREGVLDRGGPDQFGCRAGGWRLDSDMRMRRRRQAWTEGAPPGMRREVPPRRAATPGHTSGRTPATHPGRTPQPQAPRAQAARQCPLSVTDSGGLVTDGGKQRDRQRLEACLHGLQTATRIRLCDAVWLCDSDPRPTAAAARSRPAAARRLGAEAAPEEPTP